MTELCKAPPCMQAFETYKRFYHTTSPEFQAESVRGSMMDRWMNWCEQLVEWQDCGAVQAALDLLKGGQDGKVQSE